MISSSVNNTSVIISNLIDSLMLIASTMEVKIKKYADVHETIDSSRRADFLIMSVEGKGSFDIFEYDKSVLIASGLPTELVDAAMLDKYAIPQGYRALILDLQREYNINNYIETNDYYRMLNGLPDLDDTFIYIRDIIQGVDITKPVHLYNVTELAIIENMGYLKTLQDDNITKKYLKFLGSSKISIYAARKAMDYEILRIPEIESDTIKNDFKKIYYQQRNFILESVRSSAYDDAENYSGFIGILILLSSIQRMIAENIKNGINRDFYDSISIKNIFESYGVTYFPNIPTIYQRRLIKNLNNLLKYKATDKVIVDICSLFGYTNVDIFKYYLIKNHRMDGNGNFIFADTLSDPEDPQSPMIPDVEAMYELKFMQVPIEEDNIDSAIKTSARSIDYDEMTQDDIYWGGTVSKAELKQQILETEFNTLETKYMSINSMYDITKLTFEINYFFRMLMDLKDNTPMLEMKVSRINPNVTFKIFHVIVALYALMCEKQGYNASIMSDPTAVASIYGFNFKVDMNALNQFITSNGFRVADTKLNEFITTTGNILTPAQLLNVFFKNRSIIQHVENVMKNTIKIEEYRVYKRIYEAITVAQDTSEIYRKRDGTIATSYLDYIESESPIIYNYIAAILGTDNKVTLVNELMDEILISLEEYVGSPQFNYLFTNIPSSSDLIKQYIFQVIDYFKSYTIDLTSINVMYDFNDRTNDGIKLIDKINKYATFKGFTDDLKSRDKTSITRMVTRKTLVSIIDRLNLITTLNQKDYMAIMDRILYDKVIEDKSIINFSFNDERYTASKLAMLETNINISDTLTIFAPTTTGAGQGPDPT